jgi:fructose/tagatose bisphosphate aldolase
MKKGTQLIKLVQKYTEMWSKMECVKESNIGKIFTDEEDLTAFKHWMGGQTLGYEPKNNEIMYYVYDIERFVRTKNGIF